VSGALGELPHEVASLIDAVLQRRQPALAARLRAETDVALDDRAAVEDLLADEFSDEVFEPDYEPTAYGKQVDDAIGKFLVRFPIEHFS
jgi:hypothetical protein